MSRHQSFAEVNGTRLYYEIAGTGPPLVLIHGLTLDTRMWDDQFDVFAAHYQVIRYDVRGFGQSALPPTDSYDSSDDLRALLKHLGVAHAHILGLSMGGAFAINFALAYPDMTATLIPVDAAPAALGEFPRTSEEAAPFQAVSVQAQEAGIQAVKESWLAHPLFTPAWEKPEVAARLRQMVEDYAGWHWVTPSRRSRIPVPPALQRLSTIRVPTLIIVGERDLSDFRRLADALEQGIPGATKVVMPGVGHMANMEDPVRFNEIVLGFLADK